MGGWIWIWKRRDWGCLDRLGRSEGVNESRGFDGVSRLAPSLISTSRDRSETGHSVREPCRHSRLTAPSNSSSSRLPKPPSRKTQPFCEQKTAIHQSRWRAPTEPNRTEPTQTFSISFFEFNSILPSSAVRAAGNVE